MYQCNVCGMAVKEFVPYRGGVEKLPELQKQFHVIGSDVDKFGCPYCGCHDRERHLRLYLDKTGILNNKRKIRILHFAPEQHIISWLSQFKPELHILADLYASDPRYERIDIENIPYGDQSFDLVIANHVLEHVNFPHKALFEINRVLRDDGIAILQTPFSDLLEKTFEDPGIKTAEQRLFFYGQEDHVRMFGRDVFSLMREHLVDKSYQHDDLFGSEVADVYGVNSREPFFLFSRKLCEDIKSSSIVEFGVEKYLDHSLCQVSICCITYNHEAFIEKSIMSFLEQRTSFDFEIVVGDDGSTDRTREILEEFGFRYPGRIKILPRVPNMGSHRNMVRTLRACSGRYIALCDGDDYWTDPEKLEKQWFYLESHLDCVVNYAGVQANRDGGVDLNYIGGAKQNLSSLQLIASSPINTLTAMFRNVLKEFPPEMFTAGPADLFLWSLLGHYGSGYYDPRILPSVYTIHDGGIHSQKSQLEKILMRVMTNYSLYLYYRRIGVEVLSNYFLRTVISDVNVIRSTGEESVTNLLDDLADRMVSMARGEFEFDKSTLIEIVG